MAAKNRTDPEILEVAMLAIIISIMAVLMFAAMIAGSGRKTGKEKQIYKSAERHKYEKK